VYLLDEPTQTLSVAYSIGYPSHIRQGLRVGQGVLGAAVSQGEPILVGDVDSDPRYRGLVPGMHSQLAVPLRRKGRVIGAVNLLSDRYEAFTALDETLLRQFAAHVAVAIENARLYDALRKSELRMERELRIARRVQLALQPGRFLNAPAGVTVAGRFESALELGGDLHDFRSPMPDTLMVAVGDVSGKGVPAALYSAFTKELIRSRTVHGHYRPEDFSVAAALEWMNRQLHERQLAEFYCALCYAQFDMHARRVTIANSGLPYPLRWSGGRVTPVAIAGVPLGTFDGTTYDQVSFPLDAGDVYVFCTDGLFEATNPQGEEFGVRRTAAVMEATAGQEADSVVEAILDALRTFTAGTPHPDDLTAVAVRIA
jgi:sigma-B regulation protein RsbU (phosphoserine phosphatase)